MGPGPGRQPCGAVRAARPAGPGSGACRAGLALSTVCAAAEGKEGGGGGGGLGRCAGSCRLGPGGPEQPRGCGGGLTSPPGRSQGEAPVPAEHPGGSRPQGRAGDGGAIAAGSPRAAARPPAGERGPG